MEIKTLTLNGQTFTVADPDALHREDIAALVSSDPQQLSDAQKAQARANIGALSGAATIANNILVIGAASIENNILVMK